MRNDFKRSVAERWHKISAWKWQADRPYKLIAFAVFPLLTIAILERLFAADDLQWFRDWVKGSAIYGPLFFPGADTIEWKERLQGVMLLLGLPVAFCLWHWRDTNVRDQIEEQRKLVEISRKEIVLKEFQEVQLRAAGALDQNLSQEARDQLQIAALHQLRGFLRGEHGDNLIRPTIELLLSGHTAAMHRIGIRNISNQISDNNKKFNRIEILNYIEILKSKLNIVDLERIQILNSESNRIFISKTPLKNRNFDFLDLRNVDPCFEKNLSNCSFFGADLRNFSIRDSSFSGTNMQGANIRNSKIINCNLFCAQLQGADLSFSNLEGTGMFKSNIRSTLLKGIDPREILICIGAIYDENTIFENIPSLSGTFLNNNNYERDNFNIWKRRSIKHVETING